MTGSCSILAQDEEAEMNRYREVCLHIVDAVRDVPGIRAVMEHDPVNRILPHAVTYFDPLCAVRST